MPSRGLCLASSFWNIIKTSGFVGSSWQCISYLTPRRIRSVRAVVTLDGMRNQQPRFGKRVICAGGNFGKYESLAGARLTRCAFAVKLHHMAGARDLDRSFVIAAFNCLRCIDREQFGVQCPAI